MKKKTFATGKKNASVDAAWKTIYVEWFTITIMFVFSIVVIEILTFHRAKRLLKSHPVAKNVATHRQMVKETMALMNQYKLMRMTCNKIANTTELIDDESIQAHAHDMQ